MKQKTKLITGSIVKVFHDPLTCNDLEGEVTLIKHYPKLSLREFEYWKVEFSDGFITKRHIVKSNY